MDADRLIKSIVKIPKDGTDPCVVDEELLRRMMSAIDETSVEHFIKCLFKTLQANEGITRIRGLHAIDKLFRGNVTARTLIANDIRSVINSTCVIPNNVSTVAKRATKNHDKYIQATLAHIDMWDEKYGKAYSALRSMTRYLRDTLQIAMPNRRKKLAHDKKQRQVAQLVARCTAAMSDINTCLLDIEENYEQLKTCFDILFPDFSAVEASAPVTCDYEASDSLNVDDDDEYSDVQWEDEELPQLSFEETLAITGINSSYALKLSVPLDSDTISTMDNSVLIRTISDYVKQLRKYDLVRLAEWEAMFGYCKKNIKDPISSSRPKEQQLIEMYERISDLRRNVDHMVNTRCAKFLSSSSQKSSLMPHESGES